MKKVFDSWRNLNLSCSNLGEYLSSLSRSSPFCNNLRRNFEFGSHIVWNWMMIAKEILEEISLKLSPLDVVRMGKVCQHWKSILESEDIRKSSKDPDVPWLLLSQEPDSDQIAFYDFSSGRIYKIELPKLLQGGRCCGSSKGWLVIATGFDHIIPFVPYYIPHLWDPISGETVSLPSLETIPNFDISFAERFRYGVQRKIRRIEVISVGSDQLIVAAIFRSGSRWKHTSLGFCRPQDINWTIFEGIKNSFIADILFRNGVLYVLKEGPIQERLFSIRLGDYELRLVLIGCGFRRHLPVELIEDRRTFRIIRGSHKMPHLAKSTRGRLLLVWRILDTLEKHPTPTGLNKIRNSYWQTAGFIVYAIKFAPGSYSPTFTRLESLEDEALFVASSGSLSSGSGINRNCVYFLADQFHLFTGSGIFQFSELEVKHSLPTMHVPIQSSSGWFVPNFPLEEYKDF